MSSYYDDFYFYMSGDMANIHKGDDIVPGCRDPRYIDRWPIRGQRYGPFDTYREARQTAEQRGARNIRDCPRCFGDDPNDRSINAISTPMGGQPGYKISGRRPG